MEAFLSWLSGMIWNQYFIYAFLIIGLGFTIATGFVQVTQLKDMAKLTFKRNESKSGISSFQAITLSLGSRVGTGNIAGVATAITLGGPGALFWMWVMAFFGAATSFIEVTLAQIYKNKQNGSYRGGAPFYIDKGLGFRKFAVTYAIVAIIAKGFMMMNIQSNTAALGFEEAFGIHRAFIGVFLVAALGLVVFGGVKRIAKTAETIIPFMVVGYLLLCAIIITVNFSLIPDVFTLVVSSAFGAEATFGGLVGSAIAWGVQRGFFSNAAGSGGETFEGAAAEVSHPAKQGLVQSFAVYMDTWIICSMTGFVILITGMFNVEAAGVSNIPDVTAGPANVQFAIDSVFQGWGSAFLAIALLFFCFTTMLSYYYKAETSLMYLNSIKDMPWTLNVLKLGILVFALVGSIVSAEAAWTLGDIGLGSMAYLNIIGITLLSKVALRTLSDYKAQKKAGRDPVFDPVELGIENADFWEKKTYEKEEEEEKVYTVPKSDGKAKYGMPKNGY
ncbi:alanine/glycine:cation symporter family protein [Salinicoccus bachuensis]|uniref:Alanine/glycine:cation symporter family protein n=1 Tax=Salinicoccus bachuensis TaxID=3136731 RepID=A0ABZ3CLV7_9STAP